METSRKNLKAMSICMFLCVVLSAVRLITEFATGIYDFANAPEGTAQSLWTTTIVVILALTGLVMFSQLFLGFKGLSIAKNPTSSGAHITIAKIFFVVAIIAVVGAVSDLITAKDLFSGIVVLVDCLIDVAIYFSYIKYAKEVRKNA